MAEELSSPAPAPETEVQSEARFSYFESIGVIVGHGVGAGILSVPYLASRNPWWVVLLILLGAFAVNVLLHLMVAELSYRHGGAQFVQCLQKTIFKGKVGKVFTWIAFALLGLSVILNCCSYITGVATVFYNWFGLPMWAGMLIYYVFAGLIVFFGMKAVGISEKYCVFVLIAVMIMLLVVTFTVGLNPLPADFVHINNVLTLYGMISFALSSVMSVPTVVKGASGNKKQIRVSVISGTAINVGLVFLLTLITILACGKDITTDGALVDLSGKIGGWVGVVGYIFTILALSTSLWANTLNLRDILHEQFTKLPRRLCWVIVSLPCLGIALISLIPVFGASFVAFARVASVIQIITNLAIVVAYGVSRHRSPESPLLGKWGALGFQILVVTMAVVATVGSILTVY
ncbi:MAG: hypothetical protein IJU64_02550 [Bacilli bacterium]|nr:hypothetical protein [Bacilli bacterium]